MRGVLSEGEVCGGEGDEQVKECRWRSVPAILAEKTSAIILLRTRIRRSMTLDDSRYGKPQSPR